MLAGTGSASDVGVVLCRLTGWLVLAGFADWFSLVGRWQSLVDRREKEEEEEDRKSVV